MYNPPLDAGSRQLDLDLPDPTDSTLGLLPVPAAVPDALAPLRAKIPWLRLTTGFLAVALIGSVSWGYLTSQSLDRTRDELAATQQTLSSTQKDLASANKDIGDLESKLRTSQARAAGLASQVSSLQGQVQNQNACISALASAGLILGDAYVQLSVMYNLSAEGSVWSDARGARDVADSAAMDAYFKAYQAAWDGNYATANSWIDRGNAQVRLSNEYLAVMDAEVDKMNRGLDEIDALLSQYSTEDLAICQAQPASAGLST